MGILSDLLLAIAAFGACIWGLITLIKILNKIEDKDRFEKWLDFIKVFLGTFVIGLLGYFAKLSFDNRNLAILESEQIGKYVEQAMVDDLEVRLRFADYFNTVLPKNRNTGWEEYHSELLEEYKNREVDLVELKSAIEERNTLSPIIDDDPSKVAEKEKYDELTKIINKKQIDIKSTEKLVGSRTSGQASILNPQNDFVTCTNVSNNQPSGITNRFPKGKVHVFSRIYSPRSETVKIIWRDGANNILKNGSRSYTISKNEDAGYRLSTWKNIQTPGNYLVEIINANGAKIGERFFEIY